MRGKNLRKTEILRVVQADTLIVAAMAWPDWPGRKTMARFEITRARKVAAGSKSFLFPVLMANPANISR